MIPLVCWHRILDDGVFFDDFDIETDHGINVTEKDKAHSPTGTRTQELSRTMRALEPDYRPVTISPCLNRYVAESARNRAGTNETRLSLCSSQSEHGPTLSHQMSRERSGGEVQGPTGIRAEDLSHTVRALPAFYNRIAIDTNLKKKIFSPTRACFITQAVLLNCPRTSRHIDLFDKEALQLQPELHYAQHIPRPQTFNCRFFKML